MSGEPPVVAIVGPTASGKTTLAVDVARELGGEIISMDSRQVYRGMDIGTAKASAGQRAAVPHHGLDLVDPDERFSAGKFARYTRETIAAIRERGRVPILVGGTGFFLRALTHPIFREPPLDPARRNALAGYLGSLPDDELARWLRALDPPTAERLSRWGGRQRVLRSLEMPLLTGRTLPWWHEHSPPPEPALEPIVFVLQLPRETLEQRIDRRVEAMIDAGLVAEVESLLAAGYDESSPGLNATGYVELVPYVRGRLALDEAVAEVRRNTRAYARRQITWFRRQLPAGARMLDASRPRGELLREVVDGVR